MTRHEMNAMDSPALDAVRMDLVYEGIALESKIKELQTLRREKAELAEKLLHEINYRFVNNIHAKETK